MIHHPGGANGFGTCYTASTVEVAFADIVINECGRFVCGSYQVPAAELTERSIVRFACERRKTLVLADLTGAAPKALGLNNDISASGDYTTSQAWARAIHSSTPRWDRIRYVSRQMNMGFTYAIIERGGLRKLHAEKVTVALTISPLRFSMSVWPMKRSSLAVLPLRYSLLSGSVLDSCVSLPRGRPRKSAPLRCRPALTVTLTARVVSALGHKAFVARPRMDQG